MIYLAAPYSHEDSDVVARRMAYFCIVDAKLCKQGLITVSPLSKHLIKTYTDIPLTWDFWKSYSEKLMEKCDSLYVITLSGWEDSIGVQAEIQMAKERSMEIVYLDVNGDRIWL